MSLTALTLVLVSLATGGITHDADEGTVAHLWQLLMVGQLPVIAFFVIRWLPRAPKPALRILAWHVVAAIASMAPVYLLNL